MGAEIKTEVERDRIERKRASDMIFANLDRISEERFDSRLDPGLIVYDLSTKPPSVDDYVPK